MAKISETELQKRLRKLEAAIEDPSDTVALTDDQYTLTENVIYVAYASALSNLTNGTIPNQSDATDFQYSPYNIAGVLMQYRGYFSSTSIYPSGDPTDYLWESTSGLSGFESSERYYTTSSGFRKALGNPTEPGTNITWTVITAGTAVPGSAIWLAERYTVSGITSGWSITSVAAYVNSDLLIDASVTTAKLVDDAVTAAKIANSINTDIATGVTGNTTANAALPKAGGAMTGAITTNSTFDGRDVATDGTKLDGIEASADVTDATNVTAAGALMDSEVTNLAEVKAFDSSDYATAAQGSTADAALPKAGGTMTGNITTEAITETQTTKSASFSPDLTNDGTIFSCTGTMTITMPTATAGKSFTIVHATATSITWGGTIFWNGGSEPTKGSGVDIYVFVSDGTNWYGNQAGTGYAS